MDTAITNMKTIPVSSTGKGFLTFVSTLFELSCLAPILKNENNLSIEVVWF